MDKVSHESRLALEDMVDWYSLHDLLDAIADICAQKAAHLAPHDTKLAKLWEHASRHLERLAGEITI